MERGIRKRRNQGNGASQLMRFLRRKGKRICAAALCTTMVLGNLGTLANAADNNKKTYDFQLDRVSLYEALQEAVREGNTVDELNFRGPDAEDYQNLLNADGTLYELEPEIEDNDGGLHLRVFARIEDDINVGNDIDVEDDSDAKEVYEADGSEEIIFLLVNTSDYGKKAVIHVDERVTEEITVASAKEVPVSGEGPHITVNPEPVPASAKPGSSAGGSGSGGSGGANSETKVEVAEPDEDEADITIETGEKKDSETEENLTDNQEQQGSAENDTQAPAEAQRPETSDKEDDNAGQDAADEEENPDDSRQDSTGNGDGSQTEEKSDGGTANENEKDGSGTEGEAGKSEGDSSDAGSDTDDSDHGNAENSQSGESGKGEDADHDTESGSGSEKSESGKDSGSDSGHDGGFRESSVSVLSISRHKISLVAAAASPSNAGKNEAETATASDASPSDAEHTLDGDVYGTIRFGSDSAAAFATTLEQIGINAGGHMDPCEAGCSGEDCECICHEILRGLLRELDTYVSMVQGYTSETEQALFDKAMAEAGALFERAQEAGLTDEELEYFTEAYEAAYAKMAELIAEYQAELRKGQEVTIILHDIQPNGEKAAKPIEMTAAADATLKTAFSETEEASALSDCIWYEIDDSTGEKTQVNLDAEAEEGMELYTYTYDVTLTLVGEKANQNAGIMMMSLDDAETDTEEAGTIQTSLTISAREGKKLSASDFVKDGVDYSLYTWTTDDTSDDPSKTLDLRNLMDNGVTENISATAYADQGISPMAITGENEVAIGDTIELSSNFGSNSDYNVWYQWDAQSDGVATVSGNGTKASVTGVKEGKVTIVHFYAYDQDAYEIYTVTVTGNEGNVGAQVYYLLSPTSNPDLNDTGHWGSVVQYQDNNATVNMQGAIWTDSKDAEGYEKKNVYKADANLSDYIVSWPNGSEGATWTLDREYYLNTVYQAVYDEYKSQLENELGITGLTLDDITEITLVPYKISRNNGTSPDKHIDCTISVKCERAYVARFNVQMPNDAGYTLVSSENKAIENGQPDPISKYVNEEKVPATMIVDGITYDFDGWYNEKNQKVTENEWKNYVPSPEELNDDGAVDFYAHYVRRSVNVTIKKIVAGIMGDRSKEFDFTVTSNVKSSDGKESWSLKIGHEGTETIQGIPAGATLTITETDAEKYTMSVAGGTKVDNTTHSYTYTIAGNTSEDITIEVTNTKNGNVDAGVLLDSLPYVLLLAAVVAGAAFFLIRRRREDDSDLD